MQNYRYIVERDLAPAQERAILDLLPQLVCMIGANGAIDYANKAWRRYFGPEAESLSLERWLQRAHDDDRDGLGGLWKQSAETGAPFELDCRFRAPEPPYRWFRLHARPHQEDRAGTRGWVIVGTDIHDQKVRMIELEQKLDVQTDMLNASVDCIKMITPDGRLSHLNKSGCLALGVSADSGFGMDWLNLLPEEIRAPGRHALGLAREGENARFPGRSELPGEKPQYWDNMLTPLKGGDGKTVSILCVSREVTAQREAEERLRLSRERLELATRAAELGSFDYLPQAGTLDWDERCHALFGVPSGSAVSYEGTFLAGLDPEDRDRVDAAVKAALEPAGNGGFDVEFRTRGLEEGGAQRTMLAKGLVFFDGDVPVRLIGTFQDVTADRAARRKLLEAEERFRLAVQATNDAIWDWDIRRDHLVWNDALRSCYGHRPGSIEPTSCWWHRQIHPEDRDRVEGSVCAVVNAGGTDWTAEYRFQRADGRYADVRDRGYVIRDEYGRAIRMVGAMLDQTERKAIERHLEALNRTLETTVTERTAELKRLWETSPDLLLVMSFDGTIQRVNPAWTDILNYAPEQLLGHYVGEFVAADDLPLATKALADDSGSTLPSVELRHLHRDGSVRFVSWVAARTETAIYATGRHTTAAKLADKALKETEEALRQSQKVEAIGQLTGGVAHDFNNLLTVIRGSVDLLRRPSLTEDRRERYLDAISDTTDRAVKLTSQLLAFARRSSLHPKTFDVSANLATLKDMMKTLTGPLISIELALGDDACFVHADPNQFDTAIVNMAVNARDAMGRQGRLKFTVRSVNAIPPVRSHPAVAGDFVAISISDTGTGIPEAQIEHIFDPFFTTKAVGQGTGLGLSQVFGFAKQSGGEVMVESRLGEGATFTLYLPRVAPTIEEADTATGEGTVSSGSARILVIEDDGEVGKFTIQALAELGYAAMLVTDAQEALDALAADAGGFDAVFSDVVMPGMSGIELGQELRRLHPGLPVLLTSGYSDVIAQKGDHGFELLHKPYSVCSLAAFLDKAVRKAGAGTAAP